MARMNTPSPPSPSPSSPQPPLAPSTLSTPSTPLTVRPYRPEDADALADVCVRTGHDGGDARGHLRDPEVLPAIFATPYVAFDPGLAFVADDGKRAVGYILGTADTAAFFAAFRDRWLPTVAERFPEPAGPPEDADGAMRLLLHHPERMMDAEITRDYPAHLHIDLLPEAQRRGVGRRLMDTYLAALRDRGVPGVHLGVSTRNTGARAFYARLGFRELRPPEPGALSVYLGREVTG